MTQPNPWSFACLDWQDRLRTNRSLIPYLPLLDHERATLAAEVFDRLHLPDVAGQPLMREAAGDWFREIVKALHGSIDRQTGRRRIREPFLLVPKKNSKTTYGAAALFTELLLNQRPYAEFLLVSPTQQVSELAFRAIEGIIAADDKLRELNHVQPHLKKITCLKTCATIQIKSFSNDDGESHGHRARRPRDHEKRRHGQSQLFRPDIARGRRAMSTAVMRAAYDARTVSIMRRKQLPPNAIPIPPVEKISRTIVSHEYCARPREVFLSLPRVKFLEPRP